MQTEMEEVVQWAAIVTDRKTGLEKKAQVGEKNSNVSWVTFVMIFHLNLSILH